jgi:hypothetical protein
VRGVLIRNLLVRLPDALCLCSSLDFLQGILCLLPSFVEEVHGSNQLLSEFGDVGYFLERFLSSH